MEVVSGSSDTTAMLNRHKQSFSRKMTSSSSFRLSCPSLNTLRLRRIFDLFDKNADGIITVQELNQALSLLGLEADPSGLESITASFIKPGNAGLRFEDFVALHQSLDEALFGCDVLDLEDADPAAHSDSPKQGLASREESDLNEAFKVFDEDGDGFISAHELQVVLGKLGMPEGKEFDRVQQMIVSVDRNQDGRVDFFEFKHMMQSVVVRGS